SCVMAPDESSTIGLRAVQLEADERSAFGFSSPRGPTPWLPVSSLAGSACAGKFLVRGGVEHSEDVQEHEEERHGHSHGDGNYDIQSVGPAVRIQHEICKQQPGPAPRNADHQMHDEEDAQ